jgi:putative addiction module CopG family antidote
MTTISVPIPENLAEFIDEMIKGGSAETKAEVVRMALKKLAEEEAIRSVLRSRQDIKEGKVVSGDIKEIVRDYRKKNHNK